MRIGVRLSPGNVRAAAFSASGEKAADASATGNTDLSAVLARLRSNISGLVAHDDLVTSVAFDIDAHLSRRIFSPYTSELGSVLLIQITPVPPRHDALLQHPDPLVDRHVGSATHVCGGHAVTGEVLALLDEDQARDVARRLKNGEFGDIRDVAVVATGGLTSPDHERRVAEIVLQSVPGARVSTSCDFGGVVGIAGRVCSTVLNAALSEESDGLVNSCERAVHDVFGLVPVGYARGDGGRLLGPGMRAFPVVGLRANVATSMAGAARKAGLSDCEVVLTVDGALHRGEVDDGLPATDPEGRLTPQTATSVPTPKLNLYDSGVETTPAGSAAPLLVLVDDTTAQPEPSPPATPDGNLRREVKHIDATEAALLGVAQCEPMVCLDEIAVVANAAEVRSAQTAIEQRALAMTVSAGGRPGTERIVESSVMGVPYGGTAIVRLRVRSTCELSGT